MSELIGQLVISVFALLAITNPFGNLPIFISMTDDLKECQRRKLFRLIVYVAALIVLIFAIVGPLIMAKFFQVELSQLRIAGGALLIAMGIKNILFPQEHKNHDISDYNVSDDEANERIVPMAFPMLVGPGALATVIVINEETGIIVTAGAILITFALIFGLFMLAKYIEMLMGKLAMFVMSRIMQVFIMAIGVKMLLTGIIDIFGLA